MALEFLGGAILSAILEVAVDRLASREVVEFFKGRKLNEKLLERLNIMLLSINAVADDAEEKQFRNPYVKAWLDKVKDAVFKAEDILDEIDTEVSKCKLEAEAQTGTTKGWNCLSDKEIKSKMIEVLDNLEYLASKTDKLGLKAARGSGDGSGSHVPQRLPTTCLVDETITYGRDAEKENIIDWLISHTENDNKLSIISVVGMGGIGKSTVAQLVYNDPRMEAEFDIKAWVCVSDEFNVFMVTRTILEAITRSTDDTRDLNMLQVKLKEKLAGKRFLLVLDDVWNENRMQWEALQTPFNYGARGSKILVTTRSQKVASAMRSNKIHHLVKLHLEWSEDHDESQNERKVLENLQPSKLLKELSIANYGGRLFQDWFGDNLLSNVVSLELGNCKYCVRLPPLGLLPFLKKLSIGGLDAIVEIGLEFYGNGSSNISFASLESLTFEDMKEWELWECTNVSGSFPHLRWLTISNCPKLKEHLPEQLLSLKKLDIFYCQQLVASAPWAPAIDEICLRNCGKVQFDYHISTLKSLVIGKCYMEGLLLERIWHALSDTCLENLNIYDCPNMNIPISRCYHFLVTLHIKSSCDSLRTFPLDLFPKLDALSLVECSNLEMISFPQELCSLTTLGISLCPKFVSFPSGGFVAPKLEELYVSNLENLKSLPENMHILLPSLRGLRIEGCPQLESFFPQEHGSLTRLNISWCPKFLSFPRGGFFAPKLEQLYISELENLKSLPENMHVLLPSLRGLHIEGCPQLESFFPQELCSLTTLSIRGCPKFVSFPSGGFFAPRLEQLEIFNLKNLKSLPESMHILLPSLRDLHIKRCPQLESFFPQKHGSLKGLIISLCPKIVSFPRGGFSAPKLEELYIFELWNLKSLPENMHVLLPSLRDLDIRGCPQLESFCDGGLPSSLKSLMLYDCFMPISSLKWALETTNSLGHLSIGDANLESFPDQELLPPTLTSLRIHDCPNLKKLGYRGLCHLSSLRELKIFNCPKLERLPEEGLPNSISTLEIRSCPLLSQHCQNPQGEDWGKIAHIQCIVIDYELMT